MKIRSVILALILLAGLAVAGSAQDYGIAADPTRLGVGARPLGMGKAFLALADDAATIFLNPAGLSLFTEPAVTTMAGKFINEVDYYTLGLVYPTPQGVVGLGFVNSGISASLRAGTIEVVGDQFFLVPSTTEVSNFSFYDRVFLISYGGPAKRLLAAEWAKDLHLGANLKVFLVDLSGPGVSGGNAVGTDLDLALLYKPDHYYSLGLNLQNILPYGFGGRLVYASGAEDSFPEIARFGGRLRILGRKNSVWRHPDTLDALLDYDVSLNNVPALMHLGLEWKTQEILSLRMGLDQDLVGTSSGGLAPYNNFTAGVGLDYIDFRFDYAYHQYQGFRENDTHYFSLSYYPLPEIKEKIRIIRPQDKSIVYPEKLILEGIVLDPAIRKLLVDDVNTAFDDEGKFSREIFPSFGKNKDMVEGLNRAKDKIAIVPVRLLRLKSFSDVVEGYWAKRPIEFLAVLDVISGYPDGTFKPGGEITRAEFTKLLMAAIGIGDFKPRGKPYKDIRTDHWAANYIGYGARYGYVKGYPDGTFRPNNPVTRAEGVAMISRFAKLPGPQQLSMPFSDVPGRYWAADDIIKAKEAGLLEYLEGNFFEPKKPLTRAEVAEMLAKVPLLKKKIDDMLDWSTY